MAMCGLAVTPQSCKGGRLEDTGQLVWIRERRTLLWTSGCIDWTTETTCGPTCSSGLKRRSTFLPLVEAGYHTRSQLVSFYIELSWLAYACLALGIVARLIHSYTAI